MLKSKSQAKSPADIKDYMASSTNLPNRLYQYTSYQALVSILHSKTFRISRTDLLNDKAETTLGLKAEHLRSYVMSFTEASEYVSMWTMYGKSIGVKIRLDFDRRAFERNLKPEKIWFLDEKDHKFIIDNKEKRLFEISSKEKPIRLSRIAYLDIEKDSIVEAVGKKPFPVVADKELIDELTGLIKYSAWEAERETRLRITLTSEALIGRDIKYLYIDLDDQLINTFQITFNPWMTNDLKCEIRNSLDKLAGRPLGYVDSKLEGQIDESILHS